MMMFFIPYPVDTSGDKDPNKKHNPKWILMLILFGFPAIILFTLICAAFWR